MNNHVENGASRVAGVTLLSHNSIKS